MNSKSARSSCRITGTSSTSCGSACSPSSTSSTSQGTASELDQRLVPTPGRRLRHAHLPACRTGQRDRGVVLLALRRRRVDRPVHRHLSHPLVRGQRVSWINARRRSPVAGYAALLLGLALVATLYSVFTGHSAGAQSAPSSPGVAAGKALFQANCSSCHGPEAQGTSEGPSLVGSGAAAVYFQMSTGRMPAKEVGAENARKPTTFSPSQIYAIADYVA